METPRGRGPGLLAASGATLLWAGNFAAAKIAVAHLNPLLIASIRIIAAAGFFALLRPRRDSAVPIAGPMWRDLLFLAVSGIVVNQYCFAAGMKWTTPSHSALVHALIPIFVLVIGWMFLGERAGLVKLGGVALALGGTAYVALNMSAGEQKQTLIGDLLTLAGAASFAVYMVLGRRVLDRIGSFRTVTMAFVLSVPFSIPFLVGSGLAQDWKAVPWPAWAALGYMIVAATFICYTLHMYAVGRIGALRVSVFTNLQPILGAGIAHALGVDTLTISFAAAAVVVIAGVAMVQFSKR